MPQPRSRFSRRHLLALCTFLVPLAVLAVLGQSELQREGTQAQAASKGEAQQFLQGAAQAVNVQFDLQMPDLVKKSEELLADRGAVRTALLLREKEGFAALLDIILLDAQFSPVWPRRTETFGLPFSSDAPPGEAITSALQCADFLLTMGETRKAVALFEHLITLIEVAEVADPGQQRQVQSYELETRFRLATAHHALGGFAEARAGFESVCDTVYNDPSYGRPSSKSAELGLLAETKLAEMAETGSVAARVQLLRAIAESRHDLVADGLLTAVAERLSAGVPAGDPLRGEATELLREERQRAQTRTFAYAYALILRDEVRRRNLVSTRVDEGIPADVQIVSTFGGATSLLWVRPATELEGNKAVNSTDHTSLRCVRVGLHFDLGQLLAPALQPFFGADGTFVLAIEDPSGKPIIPAPAGVAEDYVAPWIEVRGLKLSAFPADAEQKIAQAAVAARNRTFLVLAVFVAAVGGALWLWRSVSREAELASLKVDLVSRVSHELKTPLALIRMYGETLGMGRARDADQASHFGGIIARESERLTTLIQRILDFSRQQAGTLQYTPELVDLGELLRKVCEAYTPHLEARGAILVESLPLDIRARCDASACESAIVNLLENAAKYAIEGDDEHEIELDLRAADGLATIVVRDRGRGIPEAEREHVFDGFYRASNAGEVRGAGLGLSLVRHFARAHGGDVAVAPRDGGGCVFQLTLPLASDPPPHPPSRP